MAIAQFGHAPALYALDIGSTCRHGHSVAFRRGGWAAAVKAFPDLCAGSRMAVAPDSASANGSAFENPAVAPQRTATARRMLSETSSSTKIVTCPIRFMPSTAV